MLDGPTMVNPPPEVSMKQGTLFIAHQLTEQISIHTTSTDNEAQLHAVSYEPPPRRRLPDDDRE